MPSLRGAAWWLNSEPLGRDELQGRVDFWTYPCINWLRTLSYGQGLVGELPRRRLFRQAHQAVVSLSSTMPDGAVLLLVTVNSLEVAPVNNLRPSPRTIGQ